MKPGDVVLVPFVFADSDDSKSRPAIIVSVSEYEVARGDSIMMAISSRIDAPRFGDYVLGDWQAAGLPRPSLAKGVIRTINRRLIARNIGSISDADLAGIRKSLRQILDV